MVVAAQLDVDVSGIRDAEREILLAGYFRDLDRDLRMGAWHCKNPDKNNQLCSIHAFALRSFLAIAAAHNQNADGGSIGKRHRRRRTSAARRSLQRFVRNVVLKSTITVVERFVVIIHAHAPDLASANYSPRSA